MALPAGRAALSPTGAQNAARSLTVLSMHGLKLGLLGGKRRMFK
jgi:hypothetical protein